MAMSVGSDGDSDGAIMSEINTTPLVDVMLVLLIIFLITVPVVIQTVPLKLPVVTNIPTTTKPENVPLSVDKNCDVFWGLGKMESNDALREKGSAYLLKEVDRLKAAGAKIELPEVHIRADSDTEYRCVGGVIFAMQRAGYQKIGFISEPPIGTVTR
ncbi:ExbD/TolR family protein [Sandaracinobacteroides saxicola]|uniref:Biopolymer transporter ExbD n=1 Tax=Sandaracinobacteroides saxicola TaxID=2759707 RepID=A0A7G5IL52_9SPHN|nr:biopolymer transporter ExbD [Sandaracinobacteroides saxicola]QMW24094.1 biopolymer transporter ExbD [Sandaracinobacteroides saxicola]